MKNYEVVRDKGTGFYFVSFDGVILSEALDFSEAVIMLETLMEGDRQND